MKRAWDTWAELSHDDPQRGYIHDGQLQPLTHEGDAEIASELLPLWMEIGMPALRREHIADVTEKWNQRVPADGANTWDPPAAFSQGASGSVPVRKETSPSPPPPHPPSQIACFAS